MAQQTDHIGDTNKMVTMKLYTEKQVKDAFKKGYEKFFDDIESLEDFANEYLQTITPIELPSDEEIGKEMDKLPFSKHIDDGMFNDGQLMGFELGAKWMRDKILNKQL